MLDRTKMSNTQKESVEVTEEETSDYDDATLEEKVEGLAYWVQDILTDLTDVVKAIKKDHYDTQDKPDELDTKLESVEASLEYIAEIRNTLEGI